MNGSFIAIVSCLTWAASALAAPPPQIALFLGYADTHHRAGPETPIPWQGSPGVVFVGQPDSSSGGWDCSAIRVDNTSGAPLTDATVTVDIGSRHFALWGTNTIPAGESLILAQTGFENFDGSDISPAGCFNCDPTLCTTRVSNTIPVIHVTIGGLTTDFFDTGQILNTGGVDSAGCPPTNDRNDETIDWLPVGSPAPPSDAPPVVDVDVTPTSGPPPLTVTAEASGSTDTDPTPIANYTFDFGDGTPAVGPQTSPTATHTYRNAGTFNVIVTVTDTGGLSASSFAQVEVTTPPPTTTSSTSTTSTSTSTSTRSSSSSSTSSTTTTSQPPTTTTSSTSISTTSTSTSTSTSSSSSSSTSSSTSTSQPPTTTSTTVAPTTPSAPSDLAATAAGKPNSPRIDLTWTDNSNNETNFVVERSQDGVNWAVIATLPANTTSYSDRDVQRKATYSYRVKAINDAGSSPYSNIASVRIR